MKNPIVLCLLIALLSSCKHQRSYELLITNGNLIDIETQKITVSDIYINNDRIVTIRDATKDDLPAKTVIDASDRYLIPGLWDNHVHFRGGETLIEDNEWFLSQYLAYGITAVRDAGGDLTPNIKKWQGEIESGARIGPTIFTSGPKIDGINPTWAGSLEVENEKSIDEALDQLESIGVDFVKLYDSKISADAYLTTLKKAQERGLQTSGHMPFTVSLNQSIDAGIDAVEHLYYVLKGCSSQEAEITKGVQEERLGFWDALPQLQETYNPEVAKGIFKTLKEQEVFVVPTLYIGRTLSYLDEVDHSKDPYLENLSDAFKQTYQGRIQRFNNSSSTTRENRKELDLFFRRLVASLHQSGVSLLAGSDAGAYNSYVYPGPSLIGELNALVDIGLSPAQALKTTTINGARFLKKEADYGSITEGKIASLLILDKNPLEHIDHLSSLHSVVHLGKHYPQSVLDSLKSSTPTTRSKNSGVTLNQ